MGENPPFIMGTLKMLFGTLVGCSAVLLHIWFLIARIKFSLSSEKEKEKNYTSGVNIVLLLSSLHGGLGLSKGLRNLLICDVQNGYRITSYTPLSKFYFYPIFS